MVHIGIIIVVYLSITFTPMKLFTNLIDYQQFTNKVLLKFS